MVALIQFFYSSVSTLTLLATIPFAANNFIAGYTLLTQKRRYIWVSVINQLLQVPAFALGSIYANYSGLGGVYFSVFWGQSMAFEFIANFSPGFMIQKVAGNFPVQSVSIDILAILFILLLVTASFTSKSETSSK
ncbi:hypothetical protein HC752_11985 [Vibrio sp. S9_S30]|uniref:hypothetical protein n=1 Tax=Vibrio sp. S9_S30 TaxID=2720226 RepID=UPI001680C03F|nr:hypothetical protein [Vibrio sp. S9_S30]MBD1557652.1 hypothetical protein [Vibrio sp. S9_S30]